MGNPGEYGGKVILINTILNPVPRKIRGIFIEVSDRLFLFLSIANTLNARTLRVARCDAVAVTIFFS